MRHPRSAALLTATALAGLSLTLAFAPNAAAADAPTLGQLSFSPSDPEAQGPLTVIGTGCLGVPVLSQSTAAGATSSAAAAALDPPVTTTASVDVTISGPASFTTSASVTPGLDGKWSTANSSSDITLGGAGDYTINATCTLVDSTQTGGGTGGSAGGAAQGAAPVADPGQSFSYDYDPVSFTVAAPPATPDPSLICGGCENVNPGGSVEISGNDFPANTLASVTLAGYGAQSSQVDADGGLSKVTFVIQANQAAGTLSGSVTAGSVTLPFSVVVTLPQAPGGDVDGNVPGGDDNGGTDTGTGDTDTTPVDVSYTSSAPTLPNTGTDSLWQGVLGGTLVLTGGGLLWLGRRRAAGAPVA